MIGIGNLDIDKLYVGNDEVEKIYLGNDLVWENGDEFIINITTVTPPRGTTDIPSGKRGAVIRVTAGDSDCTVTFNNETQTVAARTVETVVFAYDNEITGDLVVKGKFTNIASVNTGDSQAGNKVQLKINQVKKWYKKLNFVGDALFAAYTIDFDIDLPSNIVDLNNSGLSGSSFYRASYSGNNRLTFSDNLEEFYSFSANGYMQTFFSNATNNGDFWSINGYVLSVYGDTGSNYAPNRTDTFVIPTGTKKLPKSLFIGATFKLTGIQFPNDNLITKIPSAFVSNCDSLPSLTFPSSIIEFASDACNNTNSGTLTEFTFLQPRNTTIVLPEPTQIGISGGGVFYCGKSAVAKNIYTDNNISVLNYDWAVDNVTPTFYKLDRTTQISRLATPTISLNDKTLTITPVQNAAQYRVRVSTPLTVGSTYDLITTSNTTVYLPDYMDFDDTKSHTITVRALTGTGDYGASQRSTSVTYEPPTTEET